MQSIPGNDRLFDPPESPEATVRCTICGETVEFEDAARSGWDREEWADEENIVRGLCPVCN